MSILSFAGGKRAGVAIMFALLLIPLTLLIGMTIDYSRASLRLAQLNAAVSLQDLSIPSMRMEKLSGDRKGQYSIRINDQYRLCFEWRDGHAYLAEIVDYH